MKLPNIFLKGASGSGKDYSLRNLDPKSTVMINTEDKALPFRKTFPVASVKNPTAQSYFAAQTAMFAKCIANPDIRVIIVNSFTSACERILTEAQVVYTEWDVWAYYNKCITDMLRLSKTVDNKYIIFTGIDDNIVGPNGIQKNSIKVQGNVWFGKVEKEFTIVLQTHVQEIPSGGVDYLFITNRCAGFANTDIKTPPGILPERMPNDMAEVIRLCDDFYLDAAPIDSPLTAEPTN